MENTTEENGKKDSIFRVASWRKWLQALSDSKHAPLAVFVWSFLNPLLIPFPAESLLIPIALANRKRAIVLTAIASVAAALGAGAGYLLSSFLYDAFVAPFIAGFAVEQELAALAHAADPFAIFVIVFIAALTLIPDPPFIAAAGLLHLNFVLFFIAFFIGRTLRFIIVIGVVLIFGPTAWYTIERLENKWGGIALALLIVALAVAGYFVVKTLL